MKLSLTKDVTVSEDDSTNLCFKTNGNLPMKEFQISKIDNRPIYVLYIEREQGVESITSIGTKEVKEVVERELNFPIDERDIIMIPTLNR